MLFQGYFRHLGIKPLNLPYGSLGSLFKGRDEFLERLRVALQRPTPVAAITGAQAIHGLGGVGKTRTAVEYAWKNAHEYTALLFVTADSPENFARNLAGLCGAQVLNLPEQDAREQAQQVAAAVRWLDEHTGWFLIVDSVDTPEAKEAVEQLLARLQTGHVVITSRLADWRGGTEALQLDVLSAAEAADFLLERTEGKRRSSPTDEVDSILLANELDGLAVALEQAGAHIAHERLRIGAYRERWKAQEAKLLHWHDKHEMKYPRSVAVTWQTNFDQLTAEGRGLLNVLCWLATDPIPRSMIDKLSLDGDEPAIDVDAALGDLTTYSLARWGENFESALIHKLVAEVTRYRLPPEKRRGWLIRSLRMVDDFAVGEPWDVRTWARIYTPARPHIQCVSAWGDQEQIAEPTSQLMGQLGSYLLARAEFSEAEPQLRRALAINEAIYGTEHPIVAASLNNLAQLLKNMSRPAEAEPLMRRALAIDEACYGKDHPEVATDFNNLAQLLQATNRLAEAEPLMRRALAIDEATYGREHPQVATKINNLAQLLHATNRLAEAEPLMRRALAIDEASYGNDHPDVATDVNNLALLLQATNRMAEAEPLMRRALAIDEANYGNEHPRVATHLNNLAVLLKATNRLAEAEPLMRRALAIDESRYGREHPAVARDLSNLAQLLQDTDRRAEAEPLMRRALAIDEANYEKEHPEVAMDLSNLATLLQETDRLEEAEPLIRRALSINEACYGKEHPRVATQLNNLAQWLQTAGQLAEAEPLMRRALAIDEASYGNAHPTVAIRLNNLARLLQATNRLAEAEPLMRRALFIDEASYGKGHPSVAIRLNNLAGLLQATNRLVEAEPLMRRALTIFAGSLGSDYPNTKVVSENYSLLLQEMTLPESEIQERLRSALSGGE